MALISPTQQPSGFNFTSNTDPPIKRKYVDPCLELSGLLGTYISNSKSKRKKLGMFWSMETYEAAW